MIEERIRLSIPNGRDRDARIVRGEPSHIHLPRRRRPARPDDAAERAPQSDEERRTPAQPAVVQA